METSGQEPNGGRRPSPAPASWRKQADDNLKRLHSLLFGAEQALDRHDFAAAHVMSLQLLGFLDSETRSEKDASFIHPIHRDALAKLGMARQALVADSYRENIQERTSEFLGILHDGGPRIWIDIKERDALEWA